MSNSRIPQALHSMLLAMLVAIGAGGSAYLGEADKAPPLTPYLQAAANDPETSDAVKVAMVLGSFFESSYRHIGTPYIDKLGKGQPLTVCNGLTGKWIDPKKYYTPQECYKLEVQYYRTAEKYLLKDIPDFTQLPILQQASFIDFLYNLGEGSFRTSTMRKLLLQGRIEEACKQNSRWVYGTVKGIKVVLPGLVVRREANEDLCLNGTP